MSEIEKAKFKLCILRHTLNCENFTEYKMLFDDKEISSSLDKAIQALQEKAEREKQQAECGYCKDIPENTNIIEDDFNAIYVQENQLIATVSNSGSEYSANEFEADINYCPMCGRRLVEK